MNQLPTKFPFKIFQGFDSKKHIRLCLAAFFLAIIGLFFWFLRSPYLSGKIFGIYTIYRFAILVIITYILLWGAYFLMSSKPFITNFINFALTSATFLFLFCLIELPALFGLVNYRKVISPPESILFTRIKPWDNPRNIYDKELIHIHRPRQKIVGETIGDLVYWLGIATNRHYHINVQYDNHGFRNDHEIEQAPVVAIGDSFLEGGLVSTSALITTQLRRLLNIDVANLGLSGYGPQQELVVLRRYALPLRPKLILWFFFEGNDLIDVRRYDLFSQKGYKLRDLLHGFLARSFTQNSLLSLAGLTTPKLQKDTEEAIKRSGKFPIGDTEKSKLLYFAYPGSQLSEEDMRSLNQAYEIFLKAHDLAVAHGANFVFVFIPTKFRVYHDFSEFSDHGYCKDWTLNDLPLNIKKWCEVHNIPFINLTSALKAAAEQGKLVYFQDDGHWNANGHKIAAEAIESFVKMEKSPSF